MEKEKIKTQIFVKEHAVSIMKINGEGYISLTDLSKSQNNDASADVIKNWMRSKETISFLGLWEELNNSNFKLVEFDQFKNEAGSNKFRITPQKWMRNDNAIGIISKCGRYDSGTYAHPDIAFEFASWLSPEFKLYLIQEFQRLKKDESYHENVKWHANRLLSKLNYVVHTDAVKNYIVPTLTNFQKRFIYADLIKI